MGKKHHIYDDLKTGDLIRMGGKSYTLEVADTFFTRCLGLMGRKYLPSDRTLFIKPCNSIHTCFMRFPMTAVFVDKEMRVVRVIPAMSPWRMAFAPKAYSVFELDGKEGSDIKEGDILTDILRKVSDDEKPQEKTHSLSFPAPENV